MKRSATEEIQEGVRQLHEAVLRLADARGAAGTDDAERTAVLLADSAPDAALPGVVAACVLEQPHKAGAYATMVAALAGKNTDMAQEVLNAVLSHASLSGAPLVRAAQWRHVYSALLFLAHLVSLSVVDPTAFNNLVSSLGERAPSQGVCWAVLTAAMALPADVRGSLPALTALACRAPGVGIDVSLWERPPAAVPTASVPAARLECAPVAHESFAVVGWSPPEALLLALPWADGDGPFHADAAPWEAQAAAVAVRAAVEALRDNHRRCAEALMALGSLPGVRSVERLLVAFLLGGIVARGANPLLPRVVYETLLIDCCRMAPRAVPSAMARALGMLVRTPGLLSPVGADRLAAWFALHLCTFDLRWAWAQWEDLLSLEVDESSLGTLPSRLFVRATLARLLSLSYMDRVRPTLPDAFQAALAASASVSSLGDASPSIASCVALAARRADASELSAAAGGSWAVLFEALLRVGAASPGRLQHLLERYGRAVRASVPAECVPAALDMLAAALFGPAFAMALHYVLTNRVFVPAAVLPWLARQLGDPVRVARLGLPLLVLELVSHTSALPDHAASRIVADGPDAAALTRAIETMRAEHVSGVRALRIALAAAASEGGPSVSALVARDVLAELAALPAASAEAAVLRQAEVSAAVPSVSADVLSLFPA